VELHLLQDQIMDIEQISPSLEIDEHPRLHEQGWKIQPYAWALIFLFIIGGLLGLFGHGFLSREEISQPGFRIKYETALREGSVTAFEVHDLSGTEKTIIAIPVHYLSYFKIESIFPEPAETKYNGELVNYVFEGIATDKQIIFYMEPRKTGKVNSDIMVNNSSFHISNLIYP
jgi:hypothetical protein